MSLMRGAAVFQAGYSPRGARGSAARDMDSTKMGCYLLSTALHCYLIQIQTHDIKPR